MSEVETEAKWQPGIGEIVLLRVPNDPFADVPAPVLRPAIVTAIEGAYYRLHLFVDTSSPTETAWTSKRQTGDCLYRVGATIGQFRPLTGKP